MGWRITVLSLVLVAHALALPDPHSDLDYYDENADRSYKFSFDYEDFSREEEADSDGNVVGKYTYKDLDGVRRSLSYRAGANIGFVPEAGNLIDHETMQTFENFGQKMPKITPETPARYPAPKDNPVKFYAPTTPSTLYNAPAAPEPLPAPELPSTLYEAPAPPKQPDTLYNAPAAPIPTPAPVLALPTALYQAPVLVPEVSILATYEAPAPIAPTLPSSLYEAPAPVAPVAPALPVTPQPMMQMDASYNFKFYENDHSREEESDPNGNIKGSYSYVNNEGNNIQVRYSAGPEKGFVIENSQELLESVAKATEDGAIAALEARSDDVGDEANIYFEQPEIDQETWIQSKSYKYGYSGENDLSRSEISDDDGNVQGTYTIPDVNGEPILVKYRAGPLTGFVIENLAEVQQRTNPESKVEAVPALQLEPEQPVQPVQPVQPIQPLASQPAQQTYRTKNGRRMKVVKKARKPFVDPLHEENSDASYKFAYGSAEASESRQEESDSKGNIRGQYRYINQDGNPILVRYSAGAGKGFVIENSDELKENVQKATDNFTIRRKMKIVTRPRNKNSRSFFKVAKRPKSPDQSYSFKTKDFEESADSNGERFGSYNFVNAEGKNVVVRYRAGRNGFQILNPDDVLPKAPQAY